MTTAAPRALVYGDVDLNVIDGSAIWAQSMTQGLAAAGCDVTLLLKAPVRTERLLEPLLREPRVQLLRPYENALLDDLGPRGITPEQAVDLLVRADAEQRFDLIVVRGRRFAALAAHSEELRGRLWTYLTDIPQNVTELTSAATAELSDIALASHLLLCQTEELRGFLESVVPAACGKSVLFPPVVVLPEGLAAAREPKERLRLVYTGKFAPRWHTLEMTGLPAALAERGVPAELHMVGDKIHRDVPDWARRMSKALEATPHVVWHGGRPRAEALRSAAACDIGISWRAPILDASLELSTKVLEMGALGLPVLLNRTPMHENLLGEDYPLFSGADLETVADTLASAVRSGAHHTAARRCAAAAAGFTLERAVERLRGFLAHPSPATARGGASQGRRAPAVTGNRHPEGASAPEGGSTGVETDGAAQSGSGGSGLRRPLRLVIAGHDLKFFTRLAEYLSSLPGLEVRTDEWEGIRTHDRYRSTELAAWADVVICEWCGPNALFYARRKRPGQRIIVRLHRFELYAEWPRRLDIDAVDAVVCVSPYYADLTRERTGWGRDKITVLPNWVDTEQMDRPKLPGAEYVLGMIGIAPSRKRLDRGLDVLEELRRRDPRYTLAVKSKQPWEYWWVWNRPEERDYYERLYRRIRRSPELADAVVFDPFGPDVATWLRRVGFVLSTSDDESFHLAPAECAASGGVPAVLAWPGADTVYSERWVHPDTAHMAEAVHAIVSQGGFDEARCAARQEITGAYALARVCRMWQDLVVHGRRPDRADAVSGESRTPAG